MTDTPLLAWLTSLDHPRKAEVEQLVSLIAAAEPRLTTNIKWNAPNFAFGGEDRITLRVAPGSNLQIIFHRGAKARLDPLVFNDPTGLLTMKAPDRAVLELKDRPVENHTDEIVCLTRAWVQATE